MRFKSGDEEAIAKAVEQFEAQTSAEIVIIVEPRSAETRHISARIAALCSLIIVAWNLYMPWEISEVFLLLDAVIGFVIVNFLCESSSIPLKFLSMKSQRSAVKSAAQRFFTLKKVGSTRDHTGILVFVSLREQCIEVIADKGIHTALLREEWEQWLVTLQTVVEAQKTLPAFEKALAQLGLVLKRALPRNSDDINELDNTAMVRV